MATFVLVHGAWSGAFGFRHVRRMLQAKGHEVFTPSLTGLGDREHLAGPHVDLGTHIRDVVNLVLYEDLTNIVLLGFSYGGFVVSGALEHIGDRVSHLVYLDAFVPRESGDTVAGQFLGEQPRTPIAINQPWLIPPKNREFDSPEEGKWMSARRTPQPAATLKDPVYLAQPIEAYPFTRTFIKATLNPPDDPSLVAIGRCAARARDSASWRYHEIASNHMIPTNKPEELTRILCGVVEE